MATESIDISNNGSNVFTPTARRAGTPASGGAVLPLPWVENQNAGTANTSSLLFQAAANAALAGMLNHFSTNGGTPAYQITIADNGSGVFTPTLRLGGTPSSGGTLLTIPWVLNTNAGTANTNTTLLRTAFWAAYTACLNDRSTNG